MEPTSLMLTVGGGSLVAALCLLLAVMLMQGRNRSKSTRSSSHVTPGEVLFHQVGSGPYVPSLSPFIVKLETYLRLAKIPYKVVHDKQRGPKGKYPWVEYDGTVIPDSAFIIDHLNMAEKVDLDHRLSPLEKATSRALQIMMDEHAYWIMVAFRWIFDDERPVIKRAGWGPVKIALAKYFCQRQLFHQGLGRHSKGEIISILRKDLNAISEILGDKMFMFGDTPTEADCSVFGHVTQILWHLPNTEAARIIREDYPQIVMYCERMKKRVWPDWDTRILFPAEVTQDKTLKGHNHNKTWYCRLTQDDAK